MTSEQAASLQRIGASLRHLGNAMAESFRHAQCASPTPLQPLDLALGEERENLQREGQGQLASALAALRAEFGE